MKFYNPFRWHIVEICGAYYVRKIGFLCWFYADRKDPFNWPNVTDAFWRYGKHNTVEEARETLAMRQMKTRYIG